MTISLSLSLWIGSRSIPDDNKDNIVRNQCRIQDFPEGVLTPEGLLTNYYCPQTKLREGNNIFSRVCLSFCSGWRFPCNHYQDLFKLVYLGPGDPLIPDPYKRGLFTFIYLMKSVFSGMPSLWEHVRVRVCNDRKPSFLSWLSTVHKIVICPLVGLLCRWLPSAT